MNESERGKIQNAHQAGRFNDFSGIRYGKVTPTDIDGLIELSDRVFVFIETKWRDTEMPFGQRLALERLCDAVLQSGRAAMVIVATHDDGYYTERGDIDVARLPVVLVRLHREWRPPHRSLTVREAIDDFLAWTEAGNERRDTTGGRRDDG